MVSQLSWPISSMESHHANSHHHCLCHSHWSSHDLSFPRPQCHQAHHHEYHAFFSVIIRAIVQLSTNPIWFHAKLIILKDSSIYIKVSSSLYILAKITTQNGWISDCIFLADIKWYKTMHCWMRTHLANTALQVDDQIRGGTFEHSHVQMLKHLNVQTFEY